MAQRGGVYGEKLEEIRESWRRDFLEKELRIRGNGFSGNRRTLRIRT